MTTDDVRVYRSPTLLHTVTSHLLEATSGDQTLAPTDASPHWLNTLYMHYVTAGLSSARGSRFNQSERRCSSVWWPIRAGIECRPIGAVLPACNARWYRWQYKRPAPSFLTLSFLQWRSVERRKNTSVFRDDVTEVTPGYRGVTYIQVRVIDWLDLYPGQSDWLIRDGTCDWPPGGRWRHLTADGGTSGVTSHVISRDTF